MRHPSTALAAVVVDELVRQGTREAVLAPGSRSAPLAYALHEADRTGRLRLHVRVDERAAGFLALGLAKASGRVVPVVTTSGTAVANLHPACLEASHSDVPLLLLTADRPAELRGTGANQTTTQAGVFGSATRRSDELYAEGTPARRHVAWRSAVGRACAAALGAPAGDGGPVHLNLALREPLVPDLGEDQSPPPGRPDGAPWVQVATGRLTAEPLTGEPRTLMVLGDLPDPAWAAQAVELARRASWPVVAEPFGGGDRAGTLPHGALLLTASSWVEANLPRRVVVVGRPTLARATAALLRRDDVRVVVVSHRAEWADPYFRAAEIHPFAAVAATLDATDPAGEPDLEWAGRWTAAGARLAAAVGPALAASWPSGPATGQVLLRELPSAATLFVGSSNSPRDLGTALDPKRTTRDLVILGNRGLAGIDGCMSTATGVAFARPESPCYALVGDLTFLHDANALLIGPDEPRPDLTVVVVNDDGGGIFATLEPGEPARSASFERLFGTPTGGSIADVCRAFRVPHELVESPAQLAASVRERPAGLRVVEVRVDRSGHRRLHAGLADIAASVVGAAGGAGAGPDPLGFRSR